MALADRHYMRQEYHPPRASTVLLIVLVVAFVVQSALLFYGGFDLARDFGLSVEGLRAGKVWQLLTFQFLHATPWPWHLLFNCLGLYFFGKPVEVSLGSRKFLGLYFLSGAFGGLLQAALTYVLPRHADFPVVGASAGICGMIAVFCTQNPMQELTAFIYFFPVTIRARVFLLFIAGLSLFGAIIPFGNTAHGAHLGGLIIGMAFVRWGRFLMDKFSRQSSVAREPARDLARTAPTRRQSWKKTSAKSAPPPRDFMSEEVDPILDKISAQGIHSLTERERKILESARRKMGKR